MPQLKIQDVKDQIDELEKTLNQKFEVLVEEVKAVISTAKVPIDTSNLDSLFADIKKDVKKLRDDTTVLATNYNRHIIQQHAPKKK